MDALSNSHFHHMNLTGFDDFQFRQPSCLQHASEQILPFTPGGGRKVLWWCAFCRTSWYDQGQSGTFLPLYQAQGNSCVDSLQPDRENRKPLPEGLCPACTAHCLGGVPHVEEHQGGYGYRFLWERARTPAFFLCSVSSDPSFNSQQEAVPSPADQPSPSPTRVRQVLHWLATLPPPVWPAIVPLSSSTCAHLASLYPPPSQTAWCGYTCNCLHSPLGPALLVFGMTFAFDAQCSADLLLTCWRQIALIMGSVL